METIIKLLETYWIVVLSISALIFAIMIARKGIEDARESDFPDMTPKEYVAYQRAMNRDISQTLEVDEHSPGFYWEQGEKEALKSKLGKIENLRKSRECVILHRVMGKLKR
jgi:hypothetical protein